MTVNATQSGAARAISFEDALSRKGLRGFPLVVAAAALLILMIDGIDLQLLSLVAPVIIDEWGISRSVFGPALAGALIGMAGGALAGGWLGDRIGRLRALVLFTMLFGLATVAAGFTHDVASMTALRIIGGIGFGAASPNAIALASEWVPRTWRGQITSLLSIGTPAGGMVGASLVLVFLPGFGWSGTFIICGVASCAVGLLLWAALRESPGFLQQQGKLEAAARSARPVLEAGEELAGPDTLQIRTTRSDEPATLFDKRLLRLNIGTGVCFFFVSLVAYGQLAWTTVIFASANFELSAGVSAIFAFNLCSMTAATISGFLIRLFGSRVVMLGAYACLFATLALMWLLFAGLDGSPGQRETWAAIILTGLSGGTAGSAIAGIYAMMAEGYPPSCRGLGLGYGLTIGRGGGIVLSLAGGLVLDMAAGQAGPFFAILLASAAVGATGALISDRHAAPQTH